MTEPAARLLRSEPHRPALIAAALVLGAALQIGDGFYTPLALTLTSIATGLAWAAVLWPRRLGAVVPDAAPLVAWLAFLGVQAQIVVLILSPLGVNFHRPMPYQQPGVIPALLVCAVALGIAMSARRTLRRLASFVLLIAIAWLGAATYRGSPRPHIDVVTVHEAAFDALAAGTSPFSITFPDIYGGTLDAYPDGVVRDGMVHYGFPYPPLSLAMTVPGLALGDLRYSELVAWVGTGLAIIAAGTGSSLALLSAGLVLLTPRAFYALEQAWTEPLALVWLAAAVWAARRRHLVAAAALVGLAAATKQYAVVAVLLLPLLAGDDWRLARRLVTTAVVAAGITLLPALLDPVGAWSSVVMVQVREELRLDALSLAVPIFALTGQALPGALHAVVVLGATGLALHRAPRTPAGFAAAVAVALATTFLFGKKAFCNYYIFVLATLVLAVAARDDAAGDVPVRS